MNRKQIVKWSTKVLKIHEVLRLDQLLGRGHTLPVEIDASVLHQFFITRSLVFVLPRQTLLRRSSLPRLSAVTPAEVMDVVRAVALPYKQCSSDPLPTRLLKTNVYLLAPFLSRLFCWSLEHGIVPSCIKSTYIMLILKKTAMDPADSKSYRPSQTCPCNPSCWSDLSLCSL